ncbi:MAG TPA: OPT/YSL family transporter [Kofleriaceae bacterium]|nr:OPT/YSL family transporter [Kofleriaceae bacterium]
MSEIPSDDHLPGVVPKPPGTREFSVRAVVVAILVAAVMGTSYPYIVLKLGFGPNVSVVAAFFGYLFLGIAGFALGSRSNRWENNIAQTAGTSAAQTAFMCVILASFDFLGLTPPTWWQSFLWLFAASVLGILLAVPLRKHYVEDPDLTFADGVATAETVVVLDSRGNEARSAAIALFAATIVSAIVWLLTQPQAANFFHLDGQLTFAGLDKGFQWTEPPYVITDVALKTMFGLTAATAGAGFAVSLLGIGSGMIVGNRVNFSMAAGGILAWIILPKLLVPHHIIASASRGELLKWSMWPGTGMLISAGLTALALKWRTLARTFSTMSSKAIDPSEFPLAWVGIGVGLATIMLVIIEWSVFEVAAWFTVIAVVLSVPLMLVGLRVLGETNWGPISQLTNMMQAIFGALMPGKAGLTANLASSGTTGTIAVQSEAIIQDYKCGHIIGSTPRHLTYAQLIAAPIGAAAVAIMYTTLKKSYGIGGDHGLSSPISVRIANFARVMAEGFDSLPRYALLAMVVGIVLGILIALGEINWKKFMPSATGLGIGMMVPGNIVFTMVLGGLLYSLWLRLDRRSCDQLAVPMASGMIAGEALAATILSILLAAHVVPQ